MAFSIGGISDTVKNLWNNPDPIIKGQPLSQNSLVKPILNLNASADTFLAVNKGAMAAPTGSNYLIQNAAKGPLKYFGSFANKLDKVGVSFAQKAGGLISKIPGLSGFGQKLAGVSKLPGLGLLFAAGTALWGVGNAAYQAITGDTSKAAHTLIKTAGSTGGVLAGLALMATGVGFLPGLALALGAGFAGDWIGKKAADTLVPEVAAREAAEQSGSGQYQASGEPAFTGYPEDKIINDLRAKGYLG